MSARRWGAWCSGLAVAVALASSGLAVATAPAAIAGATSATSVPAGFTDTIVAAVEKPIAMAPTPDGRILVVDQIGVIRVIYHDALLPAPALDLSASVCATNAERGMLGIAVDPNFAANGFVYVYYSFKKFPVCRRDQADVPVNRVSRFTMTGNTIAPSSERILVDGIISYHGNDNGGDLGFGRDGMLYVSVGDGGCDYTGASGCDVNNAISQRANTLQGKVLRITPSGAIPHDNPFTGKGTARCNHGAIAAGKTCREIDMLGFRNPFKFASDPNPGQTRMFVNDVGVHAWEEIDTAVAGADYGWNTREGPCATGSITDCGPPPGGLTNPTFAYAHKATKCGAITGGAFVPNGLWGGAYDTGYFYGDYHCHKMFVLLPDGAGGWTPTPFATELDRYGPIALLFAPHDGSTALYYTTYANGGELHVIDQTASRPDTRTPGRAPAGYTPSGTLTAADAAAGDHFGSVAISSSGTTAIVGAPGKTVGAESNAGAVYVFVKTGTTWQQQTELTADNAAAGDAFGTATSITKDGSMVIVGAPNKTIAGKRKAGAAYVFTRSGTTWTQTATLTGTPSGRGNTFGATVALNGVGTTAAVAAPLRSVSGHRRAGAVYEFDRAGSTWTQHALLTAPDAAANDRFGWSLAAKESQVLAASPFHTNANGSSGAVYDYDDPGGTYALQKVLTAADGKANDGFGWSLDISVATMVIGAPDHVAAGGSHGAAYVLTHNDRTMVWTPRTELIAPDGTAADNFGESVAISGTTIVVGDTEHAVGTNPAQGVAYVFTGAKARWDQQAEVSAVDAGAHTEFGQSVAASSTTVMVGEPLHDVGDLAGAGLVDRFDPS